MVNVLKLFNTLLHIFLSKYCFLCTKILSEMANSVDLDQNAPLCDLVLYCLPMSFCFKFWCKKF